jgi:hypothetical protein
MQAYPYVNLSDNPVCCKSIYDLKQFFAAAHQVSGIAIIDYAATRGTTIPPSCQELTMRIAIAGLLLALTSAVAHAGGYFTEDAVPFDTLIGSSAVHQDFSGPYTQTDYSWRWGDVTFTCNATTYCNSTTFPFGGYSDHFNFVQGNFVYYAPPDSATFTFAKPIIAFGVDVYGIGTGIAGPFGNPEPTPMLFTYADGSHEYFTNDVSNWNISVPVFAGALFDKPITSVTVSGEWEGNGMFFTNLRYVTAPVPEPATYAMLAGGLLLLGAAARRTRR